MMNRIKRGLTWYLIGAMCIIGVAPRCFAGFSPSEVMTLSPAERPQELQKLQKFLENKMVRERLKDLGFAPEEIRIKLDSLTDQQIHQLALRLDEMKVAGDGAGVFIVVFLIAVLVVLIIYATGHRIVIQ
ncbi:MAG: PA2779 family protein [Syntrophaceae bacterium]|nr:PA2779 family protein [Syntrophaceae bacterium]